ncbi:MAG: sugar phosphate isomerase/epimerase [candidate division KSB1 bacterium]|nr:sugar phosphate isomerase/epimerase [candidate division KSB1 bacterium]MDZ7304511.1 sugar phosphate isomerase/epimerase [candidate division KSB1 bacterium]MDZ7313891.1 sugar phosphate isomerase/epimerase [candidate division KSB1 bacterium]
MQIGLTIGGFDGRNPSELLVLVRRFGVRFVEFNPSLMHDIDGVLPYTDEIVTGFHLPILGEHGFDFSSLEAKEKIDDIIDFINRHRTQLNLLYCVAHPPETNNEENSVEMALEFMIENLDRLEVPVLLENVETWPEREFDKLVEIVRAQLRKKFLGYCFDPAHAFLRGEDIFRRFTAIAHQIRCIHLSDCMQGKDAHLPLGQGELPVSRFLNQLAKHHYDGIINLEIVPKSFAEARAVLKSYLSVLRVFKKAKYVGTIIKMLFHGL